MANRPSHDLIRDFFDCELCRLQKTKKGRRVLVESGTLKALS